MGCGCDRPPPAPHRRADEPRLHRHLGGTRQRLRQRLERHGDLRVRRRHAGREVLAAIPVWQGANENRRLVYGDPARSIPSQLPDATVALPEGTTSAALRTFITGHGQGNADNCAEFCPRDHTFTVNAVPFTENIWRDDCRTTAAPNQQGSWQYARAGWCPGAKTYDWTIDLGAISEPTLTVGYDVQAFENTCRPEANPCAGCTLGTGCAYNDSSHTEPNYQVSAVVIAYK